MDPFASQLALANLQARQALLDRAKYMFTLDALRTQVASPRLQGLSGLIGNQPALFPSSLGSASLQPEGTMASLFRSNTSQMIDPPSTDPSNMEGGKGTFPMKLHQMLSDLERQGCSDIASFLPHGKAFAIHKPREFVRHVMPKYFRMSRFSSFQRQLNLYDFQRITEGVDRGAYRHSMFVYGQAQLTNSMKRNKIKGVKKAKEEAAAKKAAAELNGSSTSANEKEDESTR